jgi:hypothetical protein
VDAGWDRQPRIVRKHGAPDTRAPTHHLALSLPNTTLASGARPLDRRDSESDENALPISALQAAHCVQGRAARDSSVHSPLENQASELKAVNHDEPAHFSAQQIGDFPAPRAKRSRKTLKWQQQQQQQSDVVEPAPYLPDRSADKAADDERRGNEPSAGPGHSDAAPDVVPALAAASAPVRRAAAPHGSDSMPEPLQRSRSCNGQHIGCALDPEEVELLRDKIYCLQKDRDSALAHCDRYKSDFQIHQEKLQEEAEEKKAEVQKERDDAYEAKQQLERRLANAKTDYDEALAQVKALRAELADERAAAVQPGFLGGFHSGATHEQVALSFEHYLLTDSRVPPDVRALTRGHVDMRNLQLENRMMGDTRSFLGHAARWLSVDQGSWGDGMVGSFYDTVPPSFFFPYPYFSGHRT